MSSTHPLWREYEQPSDEEVERARVAPVAAAPVEVVPPDNGWPGAFELVRAQVLDALGERALSVVHVGSTAVPGLWAKPVIDVDVLVADSGDEAAYLPDLESAGFVLTVREADWEQHRCLRGQDPVANVHVWSVGSGEAQRHVAFRDWLREHEEDRAVYGELKAQLAEVGFTDVMHYNNAKSGLIYDIYERIFASDPEHPHTPHPRG